MQFDEHGDLAAGKVVRGVGGVDGVDGGLMMCSQSRVWRGVDGSSQ